MAWTLIKNIDEWCDYKPHQHNTAEGFCSHILPPFPFLVDSTFKVMEIGIYEHIFVSVADAEELLDYALKVELFNTTSQK